MSEALRVVEPEAQIMLVPQEYCAIEWPNVYALLEPAINRSNGRWTMGDLLMSLCVGDQQLWVVKRADWVEAALTSQVVQYPSRTILAIQFLGGEKFDQWSHSLLNMLEQYARDAGCDGIEAVGRFGFWPFFKERGYKKSYCTYESKYEVDQDG